MLTTLKGCPPGQPGRVLIIEDNKDVANSLRLWLNLQGHEVRVAYTGPEGVRAGDEWRPDAIVCDIGLPGLDGYGVADELHRLLVTTTARLIAVSGYGSESDRERCREHGFDAHMTKPANLAALLRLLMSDCGP